MILSKGIVGSLGGLVVLFFLLSPCFGQQKEVKKIVFIGIPPQKKAEIKGRIQLTEGKKFSNIILSQDIKRLYKTNQFLHVRTRMVPYEGGVKIEFVLQERARLSRVIISGRSNLELADIAKAIRSKKGGYYNQAFVEKDKKKIVQLYKKEGYYFAEVGSKIRSLTDNRKELLFIIREGPLLELYDIFLKGNKNFTEPEILKYIQSGYKRSYRHSPWYSAWLAYIGYGLFSWLTEDPYVKTKVEDDMEIIRRFYRSKGFLDVMVHYEDLRFNQEKKRAYLTLRIVEGSRYRVEKIFLEISGKAKLGSHQSREEKMRFLRKKIKLQEGEFFTADRLTKDLKEIQKEYRRRAYILAKTNFKIKYLYKKNAINLIYQVAEGEKIKIEKISFRGNTRTKDWVIRRYLTFFPGEWFDGDKIEESGYKINSTRFFEKFDMKLTPGSDKNSRNMVFEVKEGRTGSFMFGGGLASDFGFFGNFQFVQKNFDLTDFPKSVGDFFSGNAFVGGGQMLSLSLQPGIERSSYNLLFREPYLFGHSIIFSLNGFFYNRDQYDYVEERWGGSVTLGKRITDNLIVEGNYQFQNINIFDLRFNPPQDLIDVKGKHNLSSFTFSLTYNRLKVDRNFISYGGYRLGGSYEYAGNFLGGGFDYSKAEARARMYFWILGSDEWKQVFSFQVLAGWSEANSNTRDVPIFNRFFLGGVRAMRGFEYRGVGPRVNNVALGGNLMFFGNVAYDFPLLGNFLRGVLFADVGKLARSVDDLKTEDFRISLGFGFRIRIPVFPAPVQLYFGFPIKKNFKDERQTFHFSLGFNF